jgi:DNA-binding FadR family transcriptional regulator
MNHQQPNFDNLSLFQKLQQELARIIEETPAGRTTAIRTGISLQPGVSRATLREAMRSF